MLSSQLRIGFPDKAQRATVSALRTHLPKSLILVARCQIAWNLGISHVVLAVLLICRRICLVEDPLSSADPAVSNTADYSESAEPESESVLSAADSEHCNHKLKLAWWEHRTQWLHRHWKQFKKAFVSYWVTRTKSRNNMSHNNEKPVSNARGSQQGASGVSAKVGDVVGQPSPPTPPP